MTLNQSSGSPTIRKGVAGWRRPSFLFLLGPAEQAGHFGFQRLQRIDLCGRRRGWRGRRWSRRARRRRWRRSRRPGLGRRRRGGWRFGDWSRRSRGLRRRRRGGWFRAGRRSLGFRLDQPLGARQEGRRRRSRRGARAWRRRRRRRSRTGRRRGGRRSGGRRRGSGLRRCGLRGGGREQVRRQVERPWNGRFGNGPRRGLGGRAGRPGGRRRRAARLGRRTNGRFGACERSLDEEVVRPADQQQMFDVIATDDDELTLTIEVEDVDNIQATRSFFRCIRANLSSKQ